MSWSFLKNQTLIFLGSCCIVISFTPRFIFFIEIFIVSPSIIITYAGTEDPEKKTCETGHRPAA